MAENISAIENEIKELEEILAEKRRIFEGKKEAGEIREIPPEKEILKETLREKIGNFPQEAAPSFQQLLPREDEHPLREHLPSYLLEELKPKVQELVNLVFEKSLEEGIKRARETKNPALIDAFHDALVDELYNYLLERKKIEKVE